MSPFPEDVVAAVLRHMNDDHAGDSLIIVQANGHADATAATMTGIDETGGTWLVETAGGVRELRLPWSTPITERRQIREEIVRLHQAALA